MAANAFIHPATRQRFEIVRTDGNLKIWRSRCKWCAQSFEIVSLATPDFRSRAFALIACPACRRGGK